MSTYLPGLNFPIYSGWTQYTPVIPKLYWDVYSAEQRIKNLFMEYDKMVHYLDYTADTLNEYADGVTDAVVAALEEAHKELENLREELIKMIRETGEGSLDWDCQQGYYTSSVQAMRDMFNDVTVHAATIEIFNTWQIEDEGVLRDWNCDDLAESGVNVAGWAVMNRWLNDSNEPIYPEYLYSE